MPHLVTAFQRGEIHLAWFGGLTSVQARNLVPDAESIVQRPRDAEFIPFSSPKRIWNIIHLKI